MSLSHCWCLFHRRICLGIWRWFGYWTHIGWPMKLQFHLYRFLLSASIKKEHGPTFATHKPFSLGALGFMGWSLTGSPTWSSGNGFACPPYAALACCLFLLMLSYIPSITSDFSNASVVGMVVLVLQDINFWTGLKPLPSGVLCHSSKAIWRSLLPRLAFFTRFFAILTADSAFLLLWPCKVCIYVTGSVLKYCGPLSVTMSAMLWHAK